MKLLLANLNNISVRARYQQFHKQRVHVDNNNLYRALHWCIPELTVDNCRNMYTTRILAHTHEHKLITG